MELPPRARRIHIDLRFPRNIAGTTSACAENTAAIFITFISSRNYLRVRGEYTGSTTGRLSTSELPPRARRIHLGTLILLPHRRTTSACAENTRGWWGRYQPPGNYLRVRGEYQLLPVTLKLFAELPPRARRILHIHNALGSTRGTTSACAENTPDPNASYLILGNYLRVRGEYFTRGGR